MIDKRHCACKHFRKTVVALGVDRNGNTEEVVEDGHRPCGENAVIMRGDVPLCGACNNHKVTWRRFVL